MIPPLVSCNINTKKLWIMVTLLSRSKLIWKTIDRKNSPFRETERKEWFLFYVANKLFKEITFKHNKKSPFKISHLNTIERALSKVAPSLGYNNDFKCKNINQSVRQQFQSHAEYIICIENTKELNNIMYAQNVSVIIILFSGDDNDDSDDHREIKETINFRGGSFELHTIISISDLQV